MEVLKATGVVKTFREGSESVDVLKGASLTLRRGEIVALEGPSGSGKTTFLTILGCMLTPTSGRVAIEGREVDPARPVDDDAERATRKLRVVELESEGG